jgi:molybdopterin synthase catalytic subunit
MTAPTHEYAAVVTEPIDINALLRRVQSEGAGAATVFIGTVRNTNDGKVVTGIDYEAYGPMAIAELQAVVREVVNDIPGLSLAVEHRTGTLSVGDVSVAIVASHAHRAQALSASHSTIELLKKRVPIWKREHYADGDRQWVDPTRTARLREAESRDRET